MFDFQLLHRKFKFLLFINFEGNSYHYLAFDNTLTLQ